MFGHHVDLNLPDEKIAEGLKGYWIAGPPKKITGEGYVLLSPNAPSLATDHKFGEIYPKGVKCDGTWIPVEFRPVVKGDLFVMAEDFGIALSTWVEEDYDTPRLIVREV